MAKHRQQGSTDLISENPDLDKQPIAEQAAVAEQVPVINITDLILDSSGIAARTAIDKIAQAMKDQ